MLSSGSRIYGMRAVENLPGAFGEVSRGRTRHLSAHSTTPGFS